MNSSLNRSGNPEKTVCTRHKFCKCYTSCLLLAVGVVGLFPRANAGLIITADQGNGTAWIDSNPEIDVAGGNAPDYFHTTVDLGGSNGNSISQTFTPDADFTLGKIDLAYSKKNTTAVNIGVRIQVATVALNGAGTAYEYSFGTDLLSGLTFDLSAANTNTVNVLTLDFSGLDNITLLANTTYALEFVNMDGNNGNFALRRRGGSYYAGGAVFVNRESVNGTDTRDAGMQIFVIPEPSSVLLFGIGIGLACFSRKFRR